MVQSALIVVVFIFLFNYYFYFLINSARVYFCVALFFCVVPILHQNLIKFFLLFVKNEYIPAYLHSEKLLESNI